MAIDTQERLDADFFTGVEVENTPFKGIKHLFIVGVKHPDEIKDIAAQSGTKHLYFGTSQSFAPESDDDWNAWSEMIVPLLREGYVCILDYDVFYAEEVLEQGFDDFPNFVSMISIRLPHIDKFNSHATIKLDDTTWGHSNQGVWTHRLGSLQTDESFTPWHEYKGDEIVK